MHMALKKNQHLVQQFYVNYIMAAGCISVEFSIRIGTTRILLLCFFLGFMIVKSPVLLFKHIKICLF